LHAFIFVLSLMASALATTPDDLVVAPEANLTPPPQWLTRAQMLADLDIMDYAVTNAYAGPSLAQGIQSLRDQLPLYLAADTFCEKLEQQLLPIRDSHLVADFVGGKRCGGHQAAGHVGANLRAQEGTWGYSEVQGHAVLGIPSFPPSADNSWAGFRERVATLKAAGQPFVIDLRGNSGGDDEPATWLARELYGLSDQEPVPTPVEARLSIDRPEAFALMSNVWTLEIQRERRAGRTVPQDDYDMRTKILGWMEKAKSGQFPPTDYQEMPQPNLNGHAIFQAPVYILVDNQCASSCELLLEYLEALPHRVLIGEHTHGAVEYGEVGKLILPTSHVVVTLATFATRYRDYRTVEGKGYAPDIGVRAGADALSAVPKAD
jgi:hypothetical protein